ncbi:hypothetical protein IWX78_001362 [Mycetocola sp. CAN_C7]|uniref:hypothetical protein n=1 Tax=Mycetocola sp. CAN_C7 TaxID=2787724 RepID=UPI0018C9C436
MNDVMVSGAAQSSSMDSGGHPHLSESLGADGILALLAYEESHGKRDAVVEALTERLAAVRNGVEPSGPLGERLPRPLPKVE